MTLRISDLRERVQARFSDFEQLNDSVIRFTKKADGHPFAVCYIDIAQDLPGNQETLLKYQDRIIGNRYFAEEKSLQWNNYLYFVTDDDHLATGDTRQIKELIERDRTYARKFVISEEDLDLVLTSPVIAPTTRPPKTNILSVWTECLVEAGLDPAILSDENLPKRLALIETPPAKTRRTKQTQPAVEPEPLPFILAMRLSRFRPFPVQRDFRFGTVNLIFGPNATGKTSLLEAIELFYCGKNNRNPDTTAAYTLDVELSDGRSVRDSGDVLQEYRDRNLKWYGVLEVKTSKLYSSFSQFNFLNTDAAVSLADSTARIEDDLSKLLVGPDASKTWENINKVSDAVSSKLNELRPLERQLSEEIAALEDQIAEAVTVRQESDAIDARLKEVVLRLGWKTLEGDKESVAGELIQTFSEIAAVAHQASSIEWAESPVSLEGLANYCRRFSSTVRKIEPDISRLERLENTLKLSGDSIKRTQHASDLAQDAKRLIAANLFARIEEASKLKALISSCSDRLAGHDGDALQSLSSAPREMTVTALREIAAMTRSSADVNLKKTRSEYSTFRQLREQSLGLAQELRQIAARILETARTADECPLCHTKFGPGELVKHMALGVDENLETIGQTLLRTISEAEVELRAAISHDTVASWLEGFCRRASISAGTPVRSVLMEVQHTTKALADAQDRLRFLGNEIAELEGQGLSQKRLQEITSLLEANGFPLKTLSQEGVDTLLSQIKQNLQAANKVRETEAKQALEVTERIQGVLSIAEPSVQRFKSALSRLQERIARAETLSAKLNSLSSSFAWPRNRPISQLAVEAEAVRAIASELQTALGRETQARMALTESAKRKDVVGKELVSLRSRIKRFSDALSALDALRRKHSLSSAMESALQQNRKGIEAIFARIHSPAEFRGLGPGLATLVRKDTGQKATLSEISTGQRAAFALSIFLAQNSQLSAAPPAILIDDPIAHVDDLNSLSFLDYLREVALTGRRQIFFATASDKLATIFERKFDFMGPEGFRRFNLQRALAH